MYYVLYVYLYINKVIYINNETEDMIYHSWHIYNVFWIVCVKWQAMQSNLGIYLCIYPDTLQVTATSISTSHTKMATNIVLF